MEQRKRFTRDFKTINLDLDFFRKTGFDYKDGLHYLVARKYGAYIVTGDNKFWENAETVYKGKVLKRGDVYKKIKELF